jgi:hypothetical protein
MMVACPELTYLPVVVQVQTQWPGAWQKAQDLGQGLEWKKAAVVAAVVLALWLAGGVGAAAGALHI